MDPSTRRTASKILNALGTAALSASGSAAVLPAMAAGKIAGKILKPNQAALLMTAAATGGLARGTSAGLALAGAACKSLAEAIDPDPKIAVRDPRGRR